MRSNHPMPGNPWPHDMVITLADDDSFLTGLLFMRAAWQLDIAGVPQLDDAVNVTVSPRPEGHSAADLERLWLTDWSLAWQRYDDHADRKPAIDAAAATDAAERLSEMLALRFWGPSGMWREGVNQAGRWYWHNAVEGADRQLEWNETPEHQALPALITAWEQGLTTIIQLPYAGPYAKRINRRHLVVSRHTRMNRQLYSDALAQR